LHGTLDERGICVVPARRVFELFRSFLSDRRERYLNYRGKRRVGGRRKVGPISEIGAHRFDRHADYVASEQLLSSFSGRNVREEGPGGEIRERLIALSKVAVQVQRLIGACGRSIPFTRSTC
jgi:hypothetical protein